MEQKYLWPRVKSKMKAMVWKADNNIEFQRLLQQKRVTYSIKPIAVECIQLLVKFNYEDKKKM